MARGYYQYESSPRKYDTYYRTDRKKQSNTKNKKTTQKKQVVKTQYQVQKEKKKNEAKSHTKQIGIVIAIFAMLFAVSYREIAIMEMFNNKKDMENQLALIEKENGQVEKDIKTQESKLDWNVIKQKATEELGMKEASKIAIDLDKTDNVEKDVTLVEEDNTSIVEKIIEKLIK